MKKLPIFKEYTVDFRLQEFRKAEFGKTLEFIPFRSPNGEKLMKEYLKTPEGKLEFVYQSLT